MKLYGKALILSAIIMLTVLSSYSHLFKKDENSIPAAATAESESIAVEKCS